MGNPSDDLGPRVQELESRLAFQDDTIDELNRVVSDQWTLIDRLVRQVEVLEHRLTEAEDRLPPIPVAPPPHY